MPRLRRVSSAAPGWTRCRAGTGFTYRDASGDPLPPEDVGRIRALVIPPAWRDVWICPIPNGHLQAVGTDEAGRRQYLYHPAWRERQDKLKFDRIAGAAGQFAQMRREQVHLLTAADRGAQFRGEQWGSAVAIRLIDLGYFRIGNDVYAENEAFGLTTLQRSHVRLRRDALVFSFIGKSGVPHRIEIDEPMVVSAVNAMRRRRTTSERLLAFQRKRRWVDLDSTTVNANLREFTGEDLTAKDLRTWHATVIAARSLALGLNPDQQEREQARAIREAVAEVAAYLGNTPTVARGSYIDPRVIDQFQAGQTIDPQLVRGNRTGLSTQARVEKAVIDLLQT